MSDQSAAQMLKTLDEAIKRLAAQRERILELEALARKLTDALEAKTSCVERDDIALIRVARALTTP